MKLARSNHSLRPLRGSPADPTSAQIANKRLPKVAILGTRGYPSYYGGFETAVRFLAPHLANSGWAVTVYGREAVTPSAEADPRVVRRRTAGVESKIASTLSFGMTGTLAAAREKPDVALVMNVANGFWLPMLRARGIPTLVNVDGIEWERDKWGPTAKRVFQTGAQLTARYATEIVCDSREIARRWQEEFKRSGIFIPYGGQLLDPLPAPDGLTSGEYLLYVARFVPENSVSEFLDAAERLADRYKIVIVGSSGYGGPLEDRVRTLASTRPSVSWLGHVKDDRLLHSLWQHAGVYFHGHSVGGTNPALVQAMACGATIVARDTVYNREVLGNTGYLTSTDAGKLSQSLSMAMDDVTLQREASSSSLERAKLHYTWEGVCSQYERSLRALLAVDGNTT